jgi:hypothetical protein
MKVSEFMLHLIKQLTEDKKLAESTASAYIRALYMLNGKAPFKALTFLKKTEEIEKKIAEYADNTQKALYSTITSVLSLFKDKATYKKVYQHYHDKMMGKVKEMKETGGEKSEKTEKEEANWMDWEEVRKIVHSLKEEVGKFATAKHITPEQFHRLLDFVVLSLYTDIQPRRNKDYLNMYVVMDTKKSPVSALPTDKNYLVVSGKASAPHPVEFVFNSYKTAKKYGQQRIPVPNTAEAPLGDAIAVYLRQHPLVKGNKSKTTEYKFLVLPDGSPITAVNAITRILNRVFGKKIGSSMLRHIFLSSKYDVKEMEADAAAMGHSVAEQRNYLRGGGDNLVVEGTPHLEVSEV